MSSVTLGTVRTRLPAHDLPQTPQSGDGVSLAPALSLSVWLPHEARASGGAGRPGLSPAAASAPGGLFVLREQLLWPRPPFQLLLVARPYLMSRLEGTDVVCVY